MIEFPKQIDKRKPHTPGHGRVWGFFVSEVLVEVAVVHVAISEQAHRLVEVPVDDQLVNQRDEESEVDGCERWISPLLDFVEELKSVRVSMTSDSPVDALFERIGDRLGHVHDVCGRDV